MSITTSTSDGALLVTIDRPPVNALDLEAILALTQTFAAAARDAPGNSVVLSGGGQVFSAGVDTRAFAGYSRDQRATRWCARLQGWSRSSWRSRRRWWRR